MCLVLITWLSIISTNMKIYIVQIDMSDTYDGTDWQNADLAFKSEEQAKAHVEQVIEEYGIKREGLRIVDLELV